MLVLWPLLFLIFAIDLSLVNHAPFTNDLIEPCNLLSHSLYIGKVSGIGIQIKIITFSTTLASGGSRGILCLRKM